MANSLNKPAGADAFALKLSYWYVTHKLQLKRGLVVLLIVLNLGLFTYSIYRVLMIVIVEDPAFRQELLTLQAPLTNYQYFHQRNQPAPLQSLGVDVIADQGSNDFVIGISNTNEDWIASRVRVELLSGGLVVDTRETYVLPGQVKYVAFFNQTFSPAGTSLRLADVRWRRYLDFSSFAEPRLKFTVRDVEFNTVGQAGRQGAHPVGNLTFTVENETAYSYWQVGFTLVLRAGSRVSGINYISVDQLRSGESRLVEMRWYQPVGSVSDIQIIPEVDILNPASYMPLE